MKRTRIPKSTFDAAKNIMSTQTACEFLTTHDKFFKSNSFTTLQAYKRDRDAFLLLFLLYCTSGHEWDIVRGIERVEDLINGE